ncbi:hypothetical protein [Tahibacter soli]|uniref:Uncharacterized protein n=1 Tax=Tahibacter soli TaxID=2983605 RepID=A0A9X3YK61_9GAMM|nr:hypothetical protein [Tahibacter soli]MDC8013896.1 hypothetical protein [Tahibacter soli]
MPTSAPANALPSGHMMKPSRARMAGIAIAAFAAIAVGAMLNARKHDPTQRESSAAASPAMSQAIGQPPVADRSAASADAERSAIAALLGDGRRRQRLNDIDPQTFVPAYGALAELAAQGDVRAAVALHLGVKQCEPAPVDAHDLAGTIRDIEFRMPHDAAADEVQRVKALFDACRKLSSEQRGSNRQWVARAAALGDDEARFRFAQMPPDRATTADYWVDLDAFRATANRYLDDELAKGNRKALLAISNAYRGDSSVRKPDPTLEYAYLHAYLASGGSLPDEELQTLEQYQQRLGPAKTKEAACGIDTHS